MIIGGNMDKGGQTQEEGMWYNFYNHCNKNGKNTKFYSIGMQTTFNLLSHWVPTELMQHYPQTLKRDTHTPRCWSMAFRGDGGWMKSVGQWSSSSVDK